MKTSIFSQIFWLGIILMPSCAVKPVFSELHKGPYNYAVLNSDIINVSVTTLPLSQSVKEDEPLLMFTDLPDSLKHLYLKEMALKTKSPEELIRILKTPLSDIKPKKKELATRFYDELRIRLNFANFKKYYNSKEFMHPNTRLEILNTSLVIPENSLGYFYSIDKLENEFEEIDFGSLERSQNIKFGSKLTGDGGLGSSYSQTGTQKSTEDSKLNKGSSNKVYNKDGTEIGLISTTGELGTSNEKVSQSTSGAEAKVSAKAEVEYLNDQTIKEAIAVKLRKMKTGFSMEERQLNVSQQGRPNGDVSDNVYINVTLKFKNPYQIGQSKDVFSFGNLYDENNIPLAANKLTYFQRNVNYISCEKADDLIMATRYEGAVRVVGNSKSRAGNNALEFDDQITYYKIPASNGKDISIDKTLFCKESFKVVATVGKDTLILYISDPIKKELDLFIDDQPVLFFQWLNDQIKNPSERMLTSSKFELYFQGAEFNKIQLVGRKMDAKAISLLRKIGGIYLIPVKDVTYGTQN